MMEQSRDRMREWGDETSLDIWLPCKGIFHFFEMGQDHFISDEMPELKYNYIQVSLIFTQENWLRLPL